MMPLGVLGSAHGPSSFLPWSDNFNRADGPLVAPWEISGPGSGTIAVTSNKAVPTRDAPKHAVVDVGVTDMRAKATVTFVSGDCPKTIVRWVDANNYYQIWHHPYADGSTWVFRTIGGNDEGLYNHGSHLAAAELSCREVSGGTEVTLYAQDGVTVLYQAVDSTIGRPMGTKAGIGSQYDASGSTFDDFSVSAA